VNAVIRWAAFLLLMFSLAVAIDGTRSWLLALLIVGSMLTFLATFGAFDRSTWVGEPEEDEEYARIDAEIRAHETWREQRHSRTRI
jgi:hypothetical protein